MIKFIIRHIEIIGALFISVIVCSLLTVAIYFSLQNAEYKSLSTSIALIFISLIVTLLNTIAIIYRFTEPKRESSLIFCIFSATLGIFVGFTFAFFLYTDGFSNNYGSLIVSLTPTFMGIFILFNIFTTKPKVE
jgi:hypothetical protein